MGSQAALGLAGQYPSVFEWGGTSRSMLPARLSANLLSAAAGYPNIRIPCRTSSLVLRGKCAPAIPRQRGIRRAGGARAAAAPSVAIAACRRAPARLTPRFRVRKAAARCPGVGPDPRRRTGRRSLPPRTSPCPASLPGLLAPSRCTALFLDMSAPFPQDRNMASVERSRLTPEPERSIHHLSDPTYTPGLRSNAREK